MPAPSPDSWLELEAAKEHLNITSATTDDELTLFLRRTERAIVGKVGHVKLRAAAIDVFLEGGRPTIVVPTVPIGQVVSITVTGAAVPAADFNTDAHGWFIEDDVDEKVGIIRHTSRFPRGRVKVTYKPGRNPIPEDIELASLELLRHLWKTQRGTLANRPGLRGEPLDEATTGPRGGDATPRGFTFPNRVEQLLRPYGVLAVG